jgi:elongation factor G
MPDDDATRLPVIEIAIEPKTKADEQKLGEALTRLAEEDRSFVVSTDRESGLTILKGTSELHLDAKVEQLKHDGIGFRIGAPQVAFRECITRRVQHSYTYKQQIRGAGRFASVTLVVEPNEPGKGHAFISRITSAVVPEEFMPAIKAGLESTLCSGVVAGFPVTDVKIELVDGKYHDTDSSTMAFETAARTCFREALQQAGSVLLEPIVAVDVETPTDFAEVIVKDLRLRRGRITGEDIRDDKAAIHALVPLMNMFGYVNALRQKSMGRATFTMQFDHYAPAGPNDDDPPFGPAVGLRA